MDKNGSEIRLAHYIYLPAEDHQTAKDIWDGLIQKYDLVGLRLEDIISGEETPASDFPLLVRGDSMAVGFSIIRNIIVIELLYPFDSRADAGIIEELESSRQSFGERADYVAGETTVMVINEQATTDFVGDSTIHPFAKPEIFTGEIKGGSLSFVYSEGNLRRYYVIRQRSASDIADILTSGLPSIDMLIFKLERQAGYFKDQRSFIMKKKGDMDRGVSDILNQWAGAKSSSEKNIDLLEQDVEKLSLIYGELAGNLKLIKNAHDIVARDLEALESSVKELIVIPAGVEDFGNTLLGGYKRLLRQLEFDDELLHRSLDDTRATIEVVRTRIELERSRESYFLQKEGVSVQIAAGFIELFIIGFYTLETWELLASKEVFEHIPASVRLGIDAAFAISVVIFTHYAAKYLRKERPNPGLMLSGLGILTFLVLMVVSTHPLAWG